MKPKTTSDEQRMKQEKIYHVILKLLMNIKNKPFKQLEK
jgi:Novel STAND NTPase 3